jgi:hypothetical protein
MLTLELLIPKLALADVIVDLGSVPQVVTDDGVDIR